MEKQKSMKSIKIRCSCVNDNREALQSCLCSALAAFSLILLCHLGKGINDPSIHYNKHSICSTPIVSAELVDAFSPRPTVSLQLR